MSSINEILATGRLLAACEDTLSRTNDSGRTELAKQARALQERQTSQIVTAMRHGVTEETIRFALAMHGQGADRSPRRTQPTPAESLLDLMTQHGSEKVVSALISHVRK